MKNKYLLFLFGIFSFFIFSISSNASSSVNYDIIYKYLNDKPLIYKHGGKSADLTDKIAELSSAMDNADMNYSINIKGIPFSEGSNYSMFNIFIYEYNSDNVDINYTATVETDVTKVATSSSLSNFITNGVSISFPNPFSESAIFTIFDNLIAYIDENKQLPISSGNGLTKVGNTSLATWGFPTMYFNNDGTYNTSYANQMYLIYDTNVSFNIAETTNFDGFIINNNRYGVNSILPSYMNLNGYGKEIYTFFEDINSLGNSQIRFNFEIPKGEIFDFLFNYSVTYGIGYDSAPYFEYKTLDDNLNETILRLPLDNKMNNISEVVYYDTQTNVFPSNTIELSFVVDLEALREKEEMVKIFFESPYPFSYYYVTDSYYYVVDWSNNYGILIIPKVYNLDSLTSQDIYSDLFFKGENLFLNIYSDTISDDNLISSKVFKNYIDLYGGYKYYFSSSNKKYLLFLINKDYLSNPNSTYLKYDTRYFTYTICKSSNSCNAIINPNTGEEIVVVPPDIVDDDSSNDDGGLFSMFHFFEKPIKFIFDGVGVLYNDYALPAVQKYWYFAFGFTVFVIILKLFF